MRVLYSLGRRIYKEGKQAMDRDAQDPLHLPERVTQGWEEDTLIQMPLWPEQAAFWDAPRQAPQPGQFVYSIPRIPAAYVPPAEETGRRKRQTILVTIGAIAAAVLLISGAMTFIILNSNGLTLAPGVQNPTVVIIQPTPTDTPVSTYTPMATNTPRPGPMPSPTTPPPPVVPANTNSTPPPYVPPAPPPPVKPTQPPAPPPKSPTPTPKPPGHTPTPKTGKGK